MTARRLDPRRESALRSLSPEHEPVAGPDPVVPAGLTELSMARVLRRRDLDGLAADLLAWRAHEGAGLDVNASDVPLTIGTVVEARVGTGPVSLRLPCRVVDVFDQPRRRGFSYVALPGHPEQGQEWFVLEQAEDGAVTFTVTAASRPGSLLARLGGPVTRWVQRLYNRRYLTALDRLPAHDR